MTPWVARLLFLNVVMYVLTLVVPGLGDQFMFVPALILSRPWSIITYMFLHGGLGHIFFNMLALYIFGPRIEARLGGRRFLGLYLFSGVVGGLLSFTSPMIGVIGASGAVYGVMFAYAHYWPRDVFHIWGVIPVEVRWLVIGLTVFSLVSGYRATGDGIAHFAHLGGFLGAFIYLRVLDRTTGARRFRSQAVAAPRPALESGTAALARWSRISREGLHPVNLEELDRIMTKIQAEGVGRLSADEREFLDRFSLRTGDGA
jgi:membrane associated rhomboid family serine protease